MSGLLADSAFREGQYAQTNQQIRIAAPIAIQAKGGSVSTRSPNTASRMVNGRMPSPVTQRYQCGNRRHAVAVAQDRSRIMRKLSIGDLPGLVKFAIRHGLTSY